MLDSKTIARENIIKWMKREGLTQAELSRRMGISYQYIWRLLNSKKGLGPINEVRIVKAFNLKSVAEIYKNPEANNEMLDRLIDKAAELQAESEQKILIVEKIIDVLKKASPAIVNHLDRQLDLLNEIPTK